MPGFVIHLLHGKCILERMRQPFSEQNIRKFMMGVLMPDACNGKEKERSHFIAPVSRDSILQIPDTDAFAETYREQLSDPFVRGYMAHLRLDQCFFEDFFQRNVQFQTENGQQTLIPSAIRKVYLVRLQQYISVNELFSETYLYGYYTALNRYLIDRYRLTIPEKEIFSLPVREVASENFDGILCDLQRYFSASGTVPPVPVFDRKELELFVIRQAESFLDYERKCNYSVPPKA